MSKQPGDSVVDDSPRASTSRTCRTGLEADVRILKVSNLVYGCWQQAAARYDLNPSQVQILKALQAQDNVPMSRFPQVCPCTKSNVTAVIDSLEDKRLVERQRDETDRRVVRIRLTAEGKSLAARLPSGAELFADSPTSRLSPAEREQLCSLLEKMEA